MLEPTARNLFPFIEPLDYAEAVRRTLADLDPRRVERIWLDWGRAHVCLRHEGFLVDYCETAAQSLEALRAAKPPLVTGWETVEEAPGSLLLLQARGNLPGSLWLERRAAPVGKTSTTLFFAPKGLRGFLYSVFLRFWYNTFVT